METIQAEPQNINMNHVQQDVEVLAVSNNQIQGQGSQAI
jgi:hypothetical protein